MNAFAQLNSALADRYEIERELGRGGMATVYLARDVRHARKVALKVLDPEIGALLGVERFLAEIKVTANLQHPNLLPLFDSGAANGVLYYVMPYVEGESLRHRIDREQQLPVDEAVHIAVAIAGALAYAHRAGVVHRDLKPENILLQSGQPVVADFGIALAVSNAGGARITQTGISLGTPQYMAPEQATGDRGIDGRADIYSLGAVLYEMLVGEPPHIGHSVQAVIAKVLTDKPRSIRIRRESVPEHVDGAVLRALSKLAADRFATASEFAEALQSPRGTTAAEAHSRAIPAGTSTLSTRGRAMIGRALPWGLTVVATVIASRALLGRRNVEPPTTRFALVTPKGLDYFDVVNNSFALSPKGDRIAYLAIGSGSGSQVFVRSLDKIEPTAITPSETPRLPVFSPDGNWLAYTNQSEIKKVAVNGGPPIVLARIFAVNGLSWATPSTIIASIDEGKLAAVPAGGGAPVPVGKPDARDERVRRWPLALPNGKSVIVAVSQRADARTAELRVVSLETGEETPLGIAGTHPLGLVDGYLVYAVAEGALMAVRFDAAEGMVIGSPVPVVDKVFVSGTSGGAKAAVSASGTLVYFAGGQVNEPVIVSGSAAPEVLLKGEPREYANPRFSPDGQRIALSIRAPDGSNVWIYDRRKAFLTQLTRNGGIRPEWSPDGRRVLFIREGQQNSVWWQLADGSAPAEPLLQRGDPYEAVISPDSKYLIYRTGPGAKSNRDIMAVRLGDTIPFGLVESQFVEAYPRLSPDGHWLAYMTFESGRSEVFVRPFPQQGARVQVSQGGGTEPMWAGSGKVLFYRHSSSLVSVDVTTSPTFTIGVRRDVLDAGYITATIHQSYDVSGDGKSFLMLRSAGEGTQAIVVLNWARELKTLVTAK